MEFTNEELHVIMHCTLRGFLEEYQIAAYRKNHHPVYTKLTASCNEFNPPESFIHTFASPELTEALQFTWFRVKGIVVDPVQRKGSAAMEQWFKFRGQPAVVNRLCWFCHFSEDGLWISQLTKYIDVAVPIGLAESHKRCLLMPPQSPR
ncbi:uncharacterized protein GGS25DRAFT_525272 [Hypoxylon fragiforme]|uniref:uncharacterized protein n=1 Tax=Hypoxylon fragiforme TaxID=63214 RepID=UPI0020C6BEC7|nr:uncharacterized protein GGS25DRAFT_525272 [Hypoxylon fragiforme]KAI2603995.1 hypothetical protein GGS25DRAFT_525272 [Hypoxylon fragiforme]